MKEIHFKFNTDKLCELFNIEYIGVIEGKFLCETESSCAGEKNGFYGKTHTQETKDIISEKIKSLCKNNPSFAISRKNVGSKNGMYKSNRFGELGPMYGKTHSEKTKQKISDAAKKRYKNRPHPVLGNKLSEERKCQIAEKNSKEYGLISPEGNPTKIKNLEKFARENNLSVNCLRHVLSGRNKSHKGWTAK
jgi:hypothetical protein